MLNSKQDLERLSNKLKSAFRDEELLEFILDIGYVNKGTYEGDRELMLINEGKRELALTIKTLVEEPLDEILKHFYSE